MKHSILRVFVFIIIVLSLFSCIAEGVSVERICALFSESMSNEDYPVYTEYHANGNYIILTLVEESFTSEEWDLLRKHGNGDVTIDIAEILYSHMRELLDMCGYSNTTVITVHQLSDGTAIHLFVNDTDHSSLIVPPLSITE